MSLKDTKIIIKEGGGSPSTLKKKKKEEEEKTVAVIKTDTPASSGKTLKEVLKENTGSTRTVAEPRQATPSAVSHGTSLKREATATVKRQFTYDDYLNVKAAEKAEEMLNHYFKTGEHPSFAESSQTTPSVTRIGTPTRSLKAVIAPDYSSPNADWRRPETFKAIPWEEYDKLGKTDRTAYLKAYAENSQREKQKRDEEAQAQAMQERIEASNKMLREKFYDQMIEGKVPLDLKGLSPDTVKYLEQRAYDDLSSGRISQSKYDFLPIHTYQGIDNKRQKLYNEGTNTTAQPHLQTSGFDRYRTERYDYTPQKNNQTSLNSNNMATYGEYKDVINKAMSKVSQEILNSSDRAYFSDNFISATEDAFSKIISAIENGTPVENFSDDVKVRINITKNYNSSGLELFTEATGLVPYLGGLVGIVDYFSEEDNDPKDLFGALGGFLFEDNFKNLPEILNDPTFSSALKSAKKLSTALNVTDLLETLENFNSPDKLGIGISILVQDGKRGYYQYDAYVDKDLKFKVLGAYYTRNIEFIKDKEFEIHVK